MFTQGFDSRCVVLIALLTGMGLMGVARLAQAQCQPQELAKLLASDAAAGDSFGSSVSVSGDTAVIGAPWDDHASGAYAGSAYVFVLSGGVWTQQAKLTASDAAAYDWFGVSVAVSGDTAVIGSALGDLAGGTDAGSAYVFVRSSGVWTQQAKLTAADAAADDNFGISVSVSADTALIGACGDEHAGGAYAGSAYVFVRSGGVWTQQAKLLASDAAAYDLFGVSVAVSSDTAVIGSHRDDHAGGADAGSAYVFVRSGGVWTQQAKLTAADAAEGDYFGISVFVSGDTAVIGAYYDSHAGETWAGSAYAFVRSHGVWTQQAKLTASDATATDGFGYSVSVAGDTAVIGAPYDDHAGRFAAGSAYVFRRSGGVWMQQAKLTASDAASFDQFGFSVSVSLSADRAMIGARYDSHAGGIYAGSAYAFDLGCDGDDDGVPDQRDNCPNTPNPDQADADADGAGDACDACPGFDDRIDCNSNGVPDGCDIRDGTSEDCNASGVPDECERDADGDGRIDDCDACPDSDRAATIVIDDCDTRVPNRMLGDEGCTMADEIARLADGARNHGAFVNRVAHLVNAWRHRGLISVRQAAAIQRCAAQADIPRRHRHGDDHRPGGHGERD